MAPFVFSSKTGITVSTSFSILTINIMMMFIKDATAAPVRNLEIKF